MNTCVYCSKTFDKCTEHLLTRGITNIEIIIDFVCLECNNTFSSYEEDLVNQFRFFAFPNQFNDRKNKRNLYNIKTFTNKYSSVRTSKGNITGQYDYRGLKFKPFFQIIINDPLNDITVIPDEERFLKKLSDFFFGKIFCIEKNKLSLPGSNLKKLELEVVIDETYQKSTILLLNNGLFQVIIPTPNHINQIIEFISNMTYAKETIKTQLIINQKKHKANISFSIDNAKYAKACIKNALNVLFYFRPEFKSEKKLDSLKKYLISNDSLQPFLLMPENKQVLDLHEIVYVQREDGLVIVMKFIAFQAFSILFEEQIMEVGKGLVFINNPYEP